MASIESSFSPSVTSGSGLGEPPLSESLRGTSTGNGGGASGMVDRVAKGAHDVVDRLAEKARPAIERMQGGVGGASDSMHERADQLSELQEQWTESCRSAVREHPIASIGIAVVAGLVLSKMLSSR